MSAPDTRHGPNVGHDVGHDVGHGPTPPYRVSDGPRCADDMGHDVGHFRTPARAGIQANHGGRLWGAPPGVADQDCRATMAHNGTRLHSHRGRPDKHPVSERHIEDGTASWARATGVRRWAKRRPRGRGLSGGWRARFEIGSS